MRRVICFDLWGTLIRSTYTGPTYEDYLTQWKSRSAIQAAVRSVLMSEEAYRDPVAFDAATDDRPLTYKETYSILYRRLFICSGPYNEWPIDIVGIPDPKKVIELWLAENKAAEWIEGARETIECIRRENPQDIIILVTNTTSAGWDTVDKKLNIWKFFGYYGVKRSCIYQAAKPDPFMWENVKSDLAISGIKDVSEFWMIGDDPVIDLAVPAALGWKTILVGEQGVALTEIPSIISGGK